MMLSGIENSAPMRGDLQRPDLIQANAVQSHDQAVCRSDNGKGAQPTMGYAPAPISLGSSVMKLVLPQGLGCLSPGCQSGCGWDFQLTPCD